MCVWGAKNLKFLKKKLQWNEERVNNKLKQNWSINHDWSEEKYSGLAIGTSVQC